MSHGAFSTLRTGEDDGRGQSLAGFGQWWIKDDLPELSNLLNAHPGVLAGALQRDPGDRGVVRRRNPFRYNTTFWARSIVSAIHDCTI